MVKKNCAQLHDQELWEAFVLHSFAQFGVPSCVNLLKRINDLHRSNNHKYYKRKLSKYGIGAFNEITCLQLQANSWDQFSPTGYIYVTALPPRWTALVFNLLEIVLVGDITQTKNSIVSDSSRGGVNLWTALIQKSASLVWNSKYFSENKQHAKNPWFSTVSNRHKSWQLTKLMVKLMFALFSGDQFCRMFSGRINVEEMAESLQSSWNPPMRVL